MARRREFWTVGLLLVGAVATTAYFTSADYNRQKSAEPTTYSTDRRGAKAFLQFLGRAGVSAQRFERPFTDLPSDAGLLVMFEPLERDLQSGEQKAIDRWIAAGGSVLLVADVKGMGHGLAVQGIDNRLETDTATIIQPANVPSPYLTGVRTLYVSGAMRFANLDPKTHTTLAQDGHGGAYAVTWKQGKGRFVAVTGIAADNVGLQQAVARDADNGLFFANIASASTSPSRPVVLLDEYHQGYGFEVTGERSLWQAIGAPMRWATWYLLGLFLVLLYALNRRFGSPIASGGPQSRPSTEYVASMAGFYRRAAAADIVLEPIYRDFVRFLARHADAAPDAPPVRIAELASKRFGWAYEPLRDLMTRCEKALEGDPRQYRGGRAARSDDIDSAGNVPRRLQDPELVGMAQQIHDYRRRANIARAA